MLKMDDRVDSQGLKSLSLEKDTELEDGDDGDEDEATNLKGAETGHVQTDSSECWNDVGSALPPSPFRGEPLRGGMPAGQRKLTRSSSLAPFTQKTVEGAVVNISSVTDKLRSLGLMLDPESIQYTSASEVLGKGAMGVIYKATLARPGSAQTVVAVKQMLREEDGGSFTKQELLDAALHEMIMGCKIRAHPSIINFVGAAQHAAGLLTVYELIDGPNMENYFQWQRSKASSWRPKLVGLHTRPNARACSIDCTWALGTSGLHGLTFCAPPYATETRSEIRSATFRGTPSPAHR